MNHSAMHPPSQHMCECVDVEPGTYANTVVRPIPSHMEDYRTARLARGLSDHITIDRCIVAEVEVLWGQGIRTYGSCCGHNSGRPGYIQVHRDDIPAMQRLGYITGGGRPDAFQPQSTIRHEQTTPRKAASA